MQSARNPFGLTTGCQSDDGRASRQRRDRQRPGMRGERIKRHAHLFSPVQSSAGTRSAGLSGLADDLAGVKRARSSSCPISFLLGAETLVDNVSLLFAGGRGFFLPSFLLPPSRRRSNGHDGNSGIQLFLKPGHRALRKTVIDECVLQKFIFFYFFIFLIFLREILTGKNFMRFFSVISSIRSSAPSDLFVAYNNDAGKSFE